MRYRDLSYFFRVLPGTWLPFTGTVVTFLKGYTGTVVTFYRDCGYFSPLKTLTNQWVTETQIYKLFVKQLNNWTLRVSVG